MVFIVEVDKINEDVINFFQDSHNRIQIGNPYLNSYKGYIKRIKEEKYFIINMKIILPKVWYIGILYFFVFFLFRGFIWSFWLTPGLIFTLPFVLWLDSFTYLILLIGFNKYIKNIKVTKLNNQKALEILGSIL